MYIRIVTQKNKSTGQLYITHSLIESYRNAQGKVRKHTLLNLGSRFDFPKEQWTVLTNRIEEIQQGQHALIPLEISLEQEAQRIAKLVIQKFSETIILDKNIKKDVSKEVDYQTIDLNSLQHQHIRKIGAEHVGLHAAQQLNLSQILFDIGFNQKQVNLAF